MMQDALQEKIKETNELRTVEIDQGSQTPSSQTVEKSQVISTSQSNFGPDMSGSDDEEASEVDSFILDENDMEGSEEALEPSKFLLAAETEEGQTLQTVDPETHARLEALLEAAGISKLSSKDGKALTDPEVLRTLTSSVSSALDEATQAINCMRSEQQGQMQGAEGTPALTERDVGTVRKLYESGNVPDTTEEGESLLSLACSAGYYELAQVLLAMNANVEDRGIKGDCTPLMEAASGGYVEIVRLLILHGADVNAQSSAGNTPLHSAACGGHTDVVKELIASGASVEVHNENGHTPLMEAASAGYVDVARLLLEAGAGINTHSNEFKESALTLACYKGHLEMVKFLLEAGADQEHKTDEMHTALMEASMDGHVEVARLLLDSGAQVNMPADSFESPLTLAACGGHVELANLLIERGANIEEVNDEGYTPLMEAAREGHEEMVALLLSHGADINAQTEETQETALTLACCGGFLEVADFLIKAGADIELGCSTPLMEAAQEGHLELVRYLLNSGATVHAQTGTCDTALTYACENGHTDVAEELLEHDAELEHESEGGRTPLMKAARAGHMCTVQFLIAKGADVNRTTSTNDHTVLSLACAGGHLSVVELLLAHGADVTHKLKDGSTMIIEAAKGGHTGVVKVLLEWPNRLMTSSVDLTQPDLPHINVADDALEPRVPVQGLAHIVPPSEPDSQLPATFNLAPSNQGKNLEYARQMGKAGGKRQVNGAAVVDVKGPLIKSGSTMIGDSLQQLGHEGSILADLSDEKATEKVEAIINNIMAKELLAPSAGSKEEQIQRKQQILEELQKVERELQEKAQAQQQLEHQQQLLKSRSTPATASPAALRQAEETAKKVLEFNLAANTLASGQPGQRGLAESLCLASTTPIDLPLNDLVVQLPKLLGNSDLAAATQSLINNSPSFPPSPDPYYQHSSISQTQLPSSPTSPITSSTTLQQQPPQLFQQVAGSGSPVGGNNAGFLGTKTPVIKRNNNKVPRINKSQQPLVQQQLPPLPPSPPQQQPLPPASPQLIQPLSPIAQNFQPEHNGGLLCQEGNQISPEILLQQQQLVALQQQQHLQSLTFPHLTQQQQEQLLQHMMSQQVLQPPLGQPPFQQPLHQLLPQVQQGQQSALLTHQSAQLFHQTQQAQLLQQQLLKQTPGLATSPTGAGPAIVDTTGGAAVLPGDKTQSNLYQSSVDVDSQTESNHDTALTLACAGGHSELVSLLLAKGADIEHRDKKGFTPLILAATAGHVDVVEILLDHSADIEAQSERTKDTPLSLACSGGRYEVVELLLSRGANKEHRNVSDYTPLSLAASGGYVNIIKLLLSHGAEINSRTGSKLGISPLMLAAMNGHTAAVKLLLDMGSDINAQIETNRNTALTLACFQGRHEVVSLLVDRKANIEHRAKTGLTPLMEAASGGYVEVGRVLLDKGADVNAPPVPSSRDTALTIAADKGHYRFVELLLHRAAAVDVKNKKGNSPLWLACNGGHLDVVQLLVSAGADIDSQDNRKVSCLMAAFRKGHIKVVKWMVKHVAQFPSDSELQRFIATITDKELQKKCQQCMDIIVTAKDRQAAEANKNATSLLQEIDKERQVEEHRRQQAAKRRERRKERKKREKLEKEKDKEKNSSPEPESADSVHNDQDDDEDDNIDIEPPSATLTSTIGTALIKSAETKSTYPAMENHSFLAPTTTAPTSQSVSAVTFSSSTPVNISTFTHSSNMEARKNRRNRKERGDLIEEKRNSLPSPTSTFSPVTMATSLAATIVLMTNAGGKMGLPSSIGLNPSTSSVSSLCANSSNAPPNAKRKKNDIIKPTVSSVKNRVGDLDDFGSIVGGKVSHKDVDKLGRNLEKVKISTCENLGLNERDSILTPKLSPLGTSPRKGPRKDDGWKEVIRKSKKVTVPASAISRVIGRGGCNINAIRETSGAHVEVEKSKGSGDRFITIKGSAEATRQAHAMINALVQEPEKDLSDIISLAKGKPVEKQPKPTPLQPIDFAIGTFTLPVTASQSIVSGSQTATKLSAAGKPVINRQGSLSSTTVNGMRSVPTGGIIQPNNVWQNPTPVTAAPPSPRRSPQKQVSAIIQPPSSNGSASPGTPTQDRPVSRQLFASEQRRAGSATPSTSATTSVTFVASSIGMKGNAPTGNIGCSGTESRQSMSNNNSGINNSNSNVCGNSNNKTVSRPVSGTVRLLQRQPSGSSRPEPQPLPIVSSHVSNINSNVSNIATTAMGPVTATGNYSPFDNTIFSNVAVQFLSKKEDEKLNFASVAAAGVIHSQSSPLSSQPPSGLPPAPPSEEVDPQLQAKAPGYKVGMRTSSPQSRTEQTMRGSANIHFQIPVGSDQLDMRSVGYRGPIPMPGSGMVPRSHLSGGSLSNSIGDVGNMPPQMHQRVLSLDLPGAHHPQQLSGQPMNQPQPLLPHPGMPVLSSQKEEYSTPHQPMTLPEIKSTLNPNAPDFRVMGSSGIVSNPTNLMNGFPPSCMGDIRNGNDLGGVGSVSAGGPHLNLHTLQQQLLHSSFTPAAVQALQQQLINMQMMNPQTLTALSQTTSFLAQAAGGGVPGPSLDQPDLFQMAYNISQFSQYLASQRAPQGRSASPSMSTGPNLVLVGSSPGPIGPHHLVSHDGPGGVVGQGVGPGPNPMSGFMTPQGLPRNVSPMPVGPHRPSSAPSLPDPGHSGAMHQNNMGSPMPPCTPPLPEGKPGPEDRRVPRPIGGERAQRKIPMNTSSATFASGGDFANKLWSFSSDMNAEWMSSSSPQMTAAPLPSSVMTSSVVTGGNMAYTLSFQRDHHPQGGSGGLDGVGGFPETLGAMDHPLDPNVSGQHMMLPMFTNGLQGPYPMQQPVFNSRGINVGGGGGGGIGGGGGGGDSGLPQMWNQGIKAGPNDAGDSEPWRNWSQTDM